MYFAAIQKQPISVIIWCQWKWRYWMNCEELQSVWPFIFRTAVCYSSDKSHENYLLIGQNEYSIVYWTNQKRYKKKKEIDSCAFLWYNILKTVLQLVKEMNISFYFTALREYRQYIVQCNIICWGDIDIVTLSPVNVHICHSSVAVTLVIAQLLK